mgnify:CR=1 FL=1
MNKFNKINKRDCDFNNNNHKNKFLSCLVVEFLEIYSYGLNHKNKGDILK